MNSVCVIGKLTRHPIVRFEGESQTASFTLAVQEPGREGKAFTLYVGCVAYGKPAEACSLLNAEDLVSVQGRLVWKKQVRTCGRAHSVLSVGVREVAVIQPAEVLDVPTGARPVGW